MGNSHHCGGKTRFVEGLHPGDFDVEFSNEPGDEAIFSAAWGDGPSQLRTSKLSGAAAIWNN